MNAKDYITIMTAANSYHVRHMMLPFAQTRELRLTEAEYLA